MLAALALVLMQWWIADHDFHIKQNLYEGMGLLPRDGFRRA